MNEKQDIDLRARITTEYDATGAEAAQRSVEELNQASAKATAAQSGAVDDTTEAVNKLTDTATSGVKEQIEVTRNLKKEQTAQTESVKDTTKFYVDQNEEIKRLKVQVAGLQDKLIEQEKSLVTELENRRNKEQETSAASVQNNGKILQSIKWMQNGWVKVAQAASGLFGTIGLVTQAINLAKAAYDWFNKSAMEAEEKRKVNAEKEVQYLKELIVLRQKLTQAQQVKDIAWVNQDDAEKLAAPWKKKLQAIEEANDEMIRSARLEASLAENQDELKRINLEEALYRKKITQAEYEKSLLELEQEAENRQRELQKKEMQSKMTHADKNAEGTKFALQQNVDKRNSLASASGYMTKVEAADIELSLKQNEKRIKEAREKVKEIENKIKAEKVMMADPQMAFHAQTRQANIDRLESEKKSWNDQINNAADQRGQSQAKLNAYKKLMIEEGASAETGGLEKKVEDLDKKIEEGRKLSEEAEKTLENLHKVQEDQNKILDAQAETEKKRYENKLKQIEDEAKNTQVEANKTAIATLNEESGKLTGALTNVTAKIREFRAAQLQLLTDSGVKGDMADRVKKIGHKPELTEEDSKTLGNYRDTLSRASGGNDTGRRQMIDIIDNILKSFEMEAKETAKTNAQLEQRNKKAGALTRENRGAEKRSKMQEVYAQAQEEVGKLPGNNEVIRREMDKTKSLADRAVADNVVQPGELMELNAKLSEWLAVQRTQEGAALGAQMVAMLDQAISLATAQKAETAALKQKLSSVEVKLNNLANREK